MTHSPLFTAEAFALGARALAPGQEPWGAAGGAGLAHFALPAGALERDPGRRLAHWDSASSGPLMLADGDGTEDQVHLALDPAELRDRCQAGEILAQVLDQTWRGATEPAPVPRLMGIVNVTPDSFSDGGKYAEPEAALRHGLDLVAQGAQILDVGGESTRPGAQPVPAEEECARVLPVIEALAAATDAPISIDTTKAQVAAAALDAGAKWVNDISAGLADPEMLPLVAERDVPFVAMHRQGDPGTMQLNPSYGDPVAEVTEALRERCRAALEAGVLEERLILDPGIGFGKRLEHNLALMRRLGELRSLGRPLLLGVSRKSFIAHLSGAETSQDWRSGNRRDQPQDRLGGTAAALYACIAGGAAILRVHDVAPMAEATLVARALLAPPIE